MDEACRKVPYAHQQGIKVNTAISGYRFNQEAYEKLIQAGVTGFFVSLNGSTEEINSKSRDGYQLALSALGLLKENNYKNVTINWVMQKSNSDDFENLIHLAEEYEVSRLVVIGLKPDSKNEFMNTPTLEQMKSVCQTIRQYAGNVTLSIETCYSPLLALISDSFFFGNTNTGIEKGCMAGRSNASISVDGKLSPCRHLEYYEEWDNLFDYWTKSPVLQKIRSLEESKKAPCDSCHYGPYCRHCLAINAKIHNDLYIGNEFCPIYQEQ